MTIITSPVPAPSIIDHTTGDDIARNVRVVDVATGETIPRVISADVEAGTVSSYAVDEDGNLVRENDKYQILVVDRAIEIQWILAPAGVDVPAVDEPAPVGAVEVSTPPVVAQPVEFDPAAGRADAPAATSDDADLDDDAGANA
ncbi:hypothetical protein [Sphingomonas sp. Leaf28]|uniref:hypothetical protein n=1 Tax=Sphingomonas sp. Leaf28 TaxID=1735695 RepID=UPI0006FE1051|nr:hypothetical protein [Sphingomonas sp. Leaf28]KQN12001.1 hypothetical protein ASE79_08260 [Sphingomonas sp. Leaf28]